MMKLSLVAKSMLVQLIAFLTLINMTLGPWSNTVLTQAATVKLVPAAAAVTVDATVPVAVDVEGVNNLYGAEFHLDFDPALVQVVDADEETAGIQIELGDFLSPDFVAQNQADNTAGTIDFAVSQMAPQSAVSGSGTLAVITFRGVDEGTADVTLTDVLLADAGGMEIEASAQNGTVVVSEAGAVQPTATATAIATATATATAEPEEETPAPTATSVPATATPTPTVAPTNTPTPEGTPTATPEPVASPCTVQGNHTVRAGETVYSIGRAYATEPGAIINCNGIVNPSVIYVGTRLAIPVAPWALIPPGPVAEQQFEPGDPLPDDGTPAPTPEPSPGCRFYHTVRPGNTLTSIAIRYGVSIWDIVGANDIANPNLIFVGDLLCVP